MAFIYPENCDSPRKKTEYLYRAQELLRELHNVFSKWLHKGLIKSQYDEGLPKVLKNRYSYIKQLNQSDWDKFQKEDFTPRSNKICQEICVQRAELKKSTLFSIDIGDI